MFNAHEFAARLSTQQDRWPLLEGWADAWCNSFQILEGYPESDLEKAEHCLGLKLPPSLKELYCFAGRRLSKMNDPLVKPEDLEVAQTVLPFWAENQYVWTWGVKRDDLLLDDPPVFIDFSGCDAFGWTPPAPNRLALQNETLSEFVFQTVVGDYMQWESGYKDVQGEEEVAGLLRTCQPLGFPDWTREHFEKGRGYINIATRFYGNEDSLVLITADKYARCKPRDRDSFLRRTTQGR